MKTTALTLTALTLAVGTLAPAEAQQVTGVPGSPGATTTIDGKVLPLRGLIYHDDRKPLARWLLSQSRYAQEEAKHLLARRLGTLSKTDRIRLMGWPAPIGIGRYRTSLCMLGTRGPLTPPSRTIAAFLPVEPPPSAPR